MGMDSPRRPTHGCCELGPPGLGSARTLRRRQQRQRELRRLLALDTGPPGDGLAGADKVEVDLELKVTDVAQLTMSVLDEMDSQVFGGSLAFYKEAGMDIDRMGFAEMVSEIRKKDAENGVWPVWPVDMEDGLKSIELEDVAIAKSETIGWDGSLGIEFSVEAFTAVFKDGEVKEATKLGEFFDVGTHFAGMTGSLIDVGTRIEGVTKSLIDVGTQITGVTNSLDFVYDRWLLLFGEGATDVPRSVFLQELDLEISEAIRTWECLGTSVFDEDKKRKGRRPKKG